ncbi:hypothetical protein, partial [Burkholderia mallei]|uniref:hypothetical protein n=1 Tax=Burkholderia mallei TaxID=13373 RepID=UPI001C0E22CE
LERHHLEFVLRGHGRLQHHAIKKQKTPLGEGLSAIWGRRPAVPFQGPMPSRTVAARRPVGAAALRPPTRRSAIAAYSE